MKRRAIHPSLLVFGLVIALSIGAIGAAQGRPEIEVNDTMVSPESITHSQDGTVFFGSTAKGTIYRAVPGAAKAEAWILPGTTGLINTLGVFADDKSNTLWVCSTATGGRLPCEKSGAEAGGRRS